VSLFGRWGEPRCQAARTFRDGALAAVQVALPVYFPRVNIGETGATSSAGSPVFDLTSQQPFTRR
jgi:hypothetical protein